MHYNFDSFNQQNSSYQTEQFTLNRTEQIKTVDNRLEQLVLNINDSLISRLIFKNIMTKKV